MRQHLPHVTTEMDFMTVNQKIIQSKQIPEQTATDQSQDTNIKYQHIIYCKCNRNSCVSYTDQVPIDLVKAINELNTMDWTWKNNGITFINIKNDDDLFCHRLKTDKWLVLTKVIKDGIYTGYHWSSYPDHQLLVSTVRLFFEELSWFDMLNWSMVKWDNAIER